VKLALFVLGPPAAGKTSMVRCLMEQLDPRQLRHLVPAPKWTVFPPAFAAAGHYAGNRFDGADTVPYNGVAPALGYAKNVLQDVPLLIFDGDRFSHAGARAQVEAAGWKAVAAHLSAAPDDMAARHALRRATGSNQNPTWLLGRETKARRFSETFQNLCTVDTSNETPAQAAKRVWAWLQEVA
jgi:GTPase SAR1 family protein